MGRIVWLVALTAYAQQCPYQGGDPGSTKYSALTTVNTGNVKNLTLARPWRTGEQPNKEFGTTLGSFEAAPVTIDGTLCLSTPYNRVVALDAARSRPRFRGEDSSGRQHHRDQQRNHDAGSDRASRTPNGSTITRTNIQRK